ncbi:MAG: RIP metalloprotease RseP [Rikenellaceae bacterium]
METLIKVLQFVVSLSLLVIIHELGHFMFAKIFKTRVEKFYLFFDPWFSLFKFKRGETEYGVGWLPLGGYVKISGMIDESMDKEQMAQPVQPYEFRAKPAWQRLLIMVGGVLMNVILAVAIYIGISFAWGDEYLANDDVKYGYEFSAEAQAMGFEDGDKIVTIKGKTIDDMSKVFQEFILGGAGDVVVERDGQTVTISLTDKNIGTLIENQQFISPIIPFIVGEVSGGSLAEAAGIRKTDRLVSVDGSKVYSIQGAVELFKSKATQIANLTFVRDSSGIEILRDIPTRISEEGTIGVLLVSPQDIFSMTTREYGFFESIPAGISRAGQEISSYIQQVKLIFTPESGAYKSMGGFISIGSIFPTAWDWYVFWKITAFLSIALAVMNILPIPALDGGHVLFLLVEVISGRKMSDKAMEIFQTIGIILLIALMLLVNGNDIYRFFIK